MLRTQTKYGKPYEYNPRANVVKRLMKELGMTYTEVLDQIQKERAYLIGLLSPGTTN